MTVVSLLIAAIYFLNRPASSFDLPVNRNFSVPTYRVWLILSGYSAFLTFIYFVAAETHASIRRWLALLHFVFMALFLLLFLAFSTFDFGQLRSWFPRMPFLVVFTIYALVFAVDIVLFFAGLVMLFINLISANLRDRANS